MFCLVRFVFGVVVVSICVFLVVSMVLVLFCVVVVLCGLVGVMCCVRVVRSIIIGLTVLCVGRVRMLNLSVWVRLRKMMTLMIRWIIG